MNVGTDHPGLLTVRVAIVAFPTLPRPPAPLGAHPRVVMEILGHSTIALTMNTYSHVIPSLERDAADRMDAILSAVL